MAREQVYTLKQPVKFGGEDVTEVTISYKLKHLRKCAVKVGVSEGKDDAVLNIDLGQLIDLSSAMIGRVPAFLDELGDEDQAHLISEANTFLLSRLGTGPSS